MSWADDAFHLLKLLGMYCQAQDEWEEHYDKVFTKQFTLKEEEADYARLEQDVTLPIIQKARMAGYSYDTIIGILPGNFATNSVQRGEVLEELTSWVNDRLGIPF